MESLVAGYDLPDDVTIEAVDACGVEAEWTGTPGARQDRVMLFLHGGGYVSGSLKSHRLTVALAGREAGMRTLALAYRLAPEHPFPAAIEDVLAGYRYLVESGFRPEQIALAGESAGGGLVLAAVVSLRGSDLPLPACLWLASPWTDLALTGESLDTKAAVDPLINRAYLAELAAHYLQGADPKDPLASPLYADLAGLPPTLVQVGSAETLLDDSLRFAAAAAAADVAVRMEVWPHMIHAWHLFYEEIAEARRSLASAAFFMKSHLDRAVR